MNIYTDVTVENGLTGILTPDYIAWDFVFTDSVLDAIRAKNKRKILRKTEQTLLENGIRKQIAPIKTKEHFLNLLHFFKSANEEKNHSIVLNEHWYENKLKQGRTPESLELWVGDTLVAMKMYSYDANGFFLSHKASLRSYDQRFSMGLILDFLSFLRTQELGYHVCKTGKGKNLFGIHLQLSLYEYKVSLGLQMKISNGSVVQKLRFTQTTIENPFVILCLIENEERLFFVHPDGLEIGSVGKYKPVNRDIQSIPYSEFLLFQRG